MIYSCIIVRILERGDSSLRVKESYFGGREPKGKPQGLLALKLYANMCD